MASLMRWCPLTFNLGAGALQRSTLRRKVNCKAHSEVPEQFMRWVWAGAKKMNGLIKRRSCESLAYISNTQRNAYVSGKNSK